LRVWVGVYPASTGTHLDFYSGRPCTSRRVRGSISKSKRAGGWGRGMEAGARVEFAVDWRVCFSEQGVETYIDEYPQEPIRQVR
jgi:hypothetical protein